MTHGPSNVKFSTYSFECGNCQSGSVRGRIPLRISRGTLEDNIKMNCNRTCFDDTDWIQPTEPRSQWRKTCEHIK